MTHAWTLAAEGGRPLTQYLSAGGVIGYLLIVLSIVALAIMIANALQLRIEAQAPRHIIDRLDAILRTGDAEAARAFCDSPDAQCTLTRMFSAALSRCSRSAFGFLELRSALEEAGQRQLDRLGKLTDMIGLMAALGPMLGLLGTVVGMIGAFQTIGTLEGAARSSELSTYMAIALVTTAEGLIVAIPCTLAYAVFRRRIDRLGGELGEVSETLASHLTSGGASSAARPAPATRPVAPAPRPAPVMPQPGPMGVAGPGVRP